MKVLRGKVTAPEDLTGIIFTCIDPKNYSFSPPGTPCSSPEPRKTSPRSSRYFQEQVEICDQYAREKGVKVIETLADVENPFLPQKVELPAAEMVIVSSLRDIPTRSLSSLLRAGRSAGIPVHSVRDRLSSASPHFLPALLNAHSKKRSYWVELREGKKFSRNKTGASSGPSTGRKRKARHSRRRLGEIEISKRFEFLLERESLIEDVLEKFSQIDLGKTGRK